ncbi:MAG: alpha-E domain-containing protein [Alphaproteobacteria bacterium]
MSNGSLLSRFAEHHLWLARYVERTENLARILDVNETFARDNTGVQDWLPIVHLHADDEAFFAEHQEASAKAVVEFYIADRDNPNSIIESIRAARENARSLRHLISIELWAQLNVFYGWLTDLKKRDYDLRNLSKLCSRIKEQCQLHTGIAEGTMFRDQAFAFYNLGRQIERADQLTRLVDIKYHRLLPKVSDVGSAIDVSQWNALLRSVAGYQAFRRTHPSGMTPALVAGFLLFNPGFPRSLATCVREIRRLADALADDPGLEGKRLPPGPLEHLQEQTIQPIDQVIDRGLHEFLDKVQLNLIELAEAIGNTYFDQSPLDTQTQTQTQGVA